MHDDLVYRLLGFVLIFLGVTVFFDPILESQYPVVIDLTGFNIPVGLILIGIGCFSICSTFKEN